MSMGMKFGGQLAFAKIMILKLRVKVQLFILRTCQFCSFRD
jgi:hypothetical protein